MRLIINFPKKCVDQDYNERAGWLVSTSLCHPENKIGCISQCKNIDMHTYHWGRLHYFILGTFYSTANTINVCKLCSIVVSL